MRISVAAVIAEYPFGKIVSVTGLTLVTLRAGNNYNSTTASNTGTGYKRRKRRNTPYVSQHAIQIRLNVNELVWCPQSSAFILPQRA